MGNKNEDKRVVRKETPNIDFSKPIDITIFGTENDPCFGKLYDAMAVECKQCGDCELCNIVQSQHLHLLRGKQEKNNHYIDKEMPTNIENLDRVALDKKVMAILNTNPDEFFLVKKVSKRIAKKFDLMNGEANIELRQSIKRLKADGKVAYNKAHTKIKSKV